MKRILITSIFIFILFTACVNINIQKKSTESLPETAVPTQIDPEEEFGGIKFGMTKKEVIDTIGRQSDDILFNIDTDKIMSYYEDIYFNESYGSKFEILCCFDDNDLLYKISSWYMYELYGSEQEQIKTDYTAIKKELFNRYPIDICTDFHNEETRMSLDTENRHIYVFYDSHEICIAIERADNTETPDTFEP